MYDKVYYKGKVVDYILYKNLYVAQNLKTIISKLFLNNEKGFFYDPSDLTTIFQDAGGVSTITSSAQPLGLLLDKSKGVTIGAELMPQTIDFNSWTKTSAVTSTTTNSFTTNAAGGCTFSIFGSSNYKTYQIRVKGNSSMAGNIRSSGSGGYNVAIPVGDFDITTTNPLISPFSPSFYISLNGAGTLTADVISIKEVSGNSAYQASSSSRPILRQVPKSLGVELTAKNLWTNGTTQNTFDTLSDGRSRVICQSTTEVRIAQNIAVTIGKRYEVSVDIEAVNFAAILCTQTSAYSRTNGVTFETIPAGTRKTVKSSFIATEYTNKIGAAVSSVTTGVGVILGDVSVREVSSYYSDRNYIDYDGIDDKLTTSTLAESLTNCTILRSLPGYGTKISYNQTIPTVYEDSTNHAGLLSINRQLSNTEKLLLLNEFDKRTGLTSSDSQSTRLFFNNEVGVIYDFNDLTTMYQDASGITPVTAAGQPVGLVLDKSKNLTFGPELFNDSAAVLTYEATRKSVGSYNIASTGNVSSVTFPLGGAYKYVEVDFEITRVGSGSIYITPATGASIAISTLGRRRMRFMCYRNGNDISFVRSSTPTDVDFTVYSIREIYGNHAYQTTTASRPLLRQSPILGDQLVNNGDFTNDVSGWNTYLSTLSKVTEGARLTTTSAGNPQTTQVRSVTAGKVYLISCRFKNKTGTYDKTKIALYNSTVGDIGSSTSVASSGYLSFYATIPSGITSATLVCMVGSAEVGAYVDFNAITMQEVSGYYANRNYLDFDGVDDSLQTNSIDFSKTDEISLFTGIRKTGDSARAMTIELGNNQSNSIKFAAPDIASSYIYTVYSQATTGIITSTPTTYPTGKLNVVSALSKLSKGNLSLRVDGVLKGQQVGQDQGVGNFGNYPLYIGRRGGSTLPFAGNLFSIIMLSRLTTDDETLILEKAIARQTGVSL